MCAEYEPVVPNPVASSGGERHPHLGLRNIIINLVTEIWIGIDQAAFVIS